MRTNLHKLSSPFAIPTATTAALLLLLLLLLVSEEGVNSQTLLYNSTYAELNPIPCVRLLNATGTIGCQSIRGGVSGVLYDLPTDSAIEAFLKKTPNQIHTVIIPFSLLSKENIKAFIATGKVSGILVLIPKKTKPTFSPDKPCPNCEFGPYASEFNQGIAYPWNPTGSGLIFENYNIPIFAVTEFQGDTFDKLKKAAEENQKKNYAKYPLNAVELSSFMWSAVDSATCLRRGWCIPLGGLSIYSTPSYKIQNNDNKEIIMLTVGMNSRSYFHGLSVGADNNVSGMVALLATATALQMSKIDLTNLQRHIMFTFFNGEAWGYAGSQRFLSDISTPFKCLKEFKAPNPGCPYTKAACSFPCRRDLKYQSINPDRITTVLEFMQLGLTKNDSVWLHTHQLAPNNILLGQSLMSQGGPLFKMASTPESRTKLPAGASTGTFVSRSPNIANMVISGFQKQFEPYYNSDLDDELEDFNATAAAICTTATAVARSVYGLASGGQNGTDIKADCQLVKELLDCLISNYTCDLINGLVSLAGQDDVDRISHYSVYQFGLADLISQFVYRYMFNLTAFERGKSCKTLTDCSEGQACIAQQCLSGYTRYHDAYGMGLEMGEDGGFKVKDAKKAVWTESTWDPATLRIFLMSSVFEDVVQLAIGCGVTIISMAAVLVAKRHNRLIMQF